MTREPLVLMGSLVTWTSLVSPFLQVLDVGEGAARMDFALAWPRARRRPIPRRPLRRGSPALRLARPGLRPASAPRHPSGCRHVFLVLLLVLFGLEEVGGVQEGALLEADVDERRLDPGKDGFNPSRDRCPRQTAGGPDGRPAIRQGGRPRGWPRGFPAGVPLMRISRFNVVTSTRPGIEGSPVGRRRSWSRSQRWKRGLRRPCWRPAQGLSEGRHPKGNRPARTVAPDRKRSRPR